MRRPNERTNDFFVTVLPFFGATGRVIIARQHVVLLLDCVVFFFSPDPRVVVVVGFAAPSRKRDSDMINVTIINNIS